MKAELNMKSKRYVGGRIKRYIVITEIFLWIQRLLSDLFHRKSSNLACCSMAVSI
jgi:hypothetical protein